MRPAMKQLSKHVPLVLGVILVVGVLIFINLDRGFVHNELAALYLIPQPEKLTELYFDNSTHLPGTTTSGKEISFAFVIHNLETTDYQYTYSIAVNVSGTKHIIDSGNILVKDNQYYVKNEKFNPGNLHGRQEVVVELTNKQQSIDFWIGK
jgi:hypothetical protein